MRGRPAGQMTHRRRQVLEAYQSAAERGEHISLSRMARECGFSDYRNVKRVLRELRQMSIVA